MTEQALNSPPSAVGETAPAVANDDAVKTDFLAGRALAQRGNPTAELDALLPKAPSAVSRETSGAAAPAPAAAAGATEGAAGATPSGQAPIRMGFATPMPDAMANLLPIGGKVLSALGATAKDIGKGALDAPRQIAGGLLDYGNNLMRFADDVVKKAEDAGAPNVYFRLLDKDGKWAPAIQSADEFRKAQAEGSDDILQVPTTGAAESVTGNIVRAGTTFLAGRGNLAGRLGGGFAANVAASGVSGATGTDPDQARLSNIVDQVAPNFLTDWLKAKPGEDPALLARLKSGLEYAGLDAAFGGIVRGLKWARENFKSEGPDAATLGEGKSGMAPDLAETTPPAQPAHEGLPEGYGEGLTPPAEGAAETAAAPGGAPGATAGAGKPAYFPLGDVKAPKIDLSPDVESQAKAYLAGEGGANPVNINLERIGSGDDIKAILADVSSHIPATGPIGHEATQMAADAVGLTVEDFLAGRAGSALSREELLAARMALDSSASQLGKYAAAAVDPATATPEAQALAIKAFATHRALQQYVEGAMSEAGRTLEALKILSQTRSGYTDAVKAIVEGGGEDANTLFERVAALGDPTKISAFVGQSGRLPGRDPLLYGFYNTLLSYKTVVKKAVSDAGMALWNTATRYAAENYGSGAIPPGETAALGYGYIGSLKDAFRAAGAALKAGESQFHPEAQSMDSLHATRLSLLANGFQLTPEQPTAAAFSYLRSALPTSWIGAVDDFAKVMNYRAELQSLAYRNGTQAGLEGEALAAHVAENVASPGSALHQQALAAALKTTFQEPLSGFAEHLQSMRDSLQIPLPHTDFTIPAGRILLPFLKVPTNIAKWTYQNSALALAFPSDAIKADLAAGGAARDLVLARVGLGSAVALTMADLALLGHVTGRGPSDPGLNRAWRAAGNEPYSIRVGGTWYGYNQVEPMGLMTGAIADTYNAMKFARDPDRESLAASLVFGAGNAMLSKTYMQQLSDFLEAVAHPDKDATRYSDRLLAGFAVPNAVAGVTHAVDPFIRQHYGLLDAIEAKLPYLSQGLPPARTLWGDPITAKDAFMPPFSGTGVARMLSPIPTRPADPGAPGGAEPIDKWIWDNRESFPHSDQQKMGIYKPGLVQSYSAGPGVSAQVELTPEQHDRLQVLAGNELKDPKTGLGAKDYLNALVEGKNPDAGTQAQWDKASPALQALMVQSIVNKFRNSAKQQLRGENPDIGEALQAGWGQRRDQLKGGGSALRPGAVSAAPAMPTLQ